MTASLRRTVIVSMAGLGVAAVLAWASVTAPGDVVGEQSPTTGATSVPSSQRTQPPAQDDEQRDRPPSSRDRSAASSWIVDLVTAVGFIGGLWFVAMVARGLVVRFSAYIPEKQLVLDLDTLPDVALGREALTRDHARQRAALAASDVRNGIVACWVMLEQVAADAGVVRRPAETATEFVVRFLHALDVDPRPVAELAGLFHEARFSTHLLTDDARARAQRALEGIHRDLVGRTV